MSTSGSVILESVEYPTFQSMKIEIPTLMYAIVIIEFQGTCVKIATLTDSTGNLIERFNSCFSGVTRTIIIGGSASESTSYNLRLDGMHYNCGETPIDQPIATTLFNHAGSNGPQTSPSAQTYLYAVNGSNPAKEGSDSFGVTVVLQAIPTGI